MPPPPPPRPPPWFVPTGLAPPPRPAAEATIDELLALPPAELAVLADFAERLPSREQLLGAVRSGDAARAEALLRAARDATGGLERELADGRGADGRSAAMVAAEAGDSTILALLLSLGGADLAITDGRGGSLLHVAARSGALGCARVLIRLESKMKDAVDCARQTPLHVAVADGRLDMVHLLLCVGSSAARPDARGRTALHLAAAAGHAEVILELLHAVTATAGDLDALLTAKDSDRRSARAVAAAASQKLAVKMLELFGAWPSIARRPLLARLRGGFPRPKRSASALLKQVMELAADPSLLTLGAENVSKLTKPLPRHAPRTPRTRRKAPLESGRVQSLYEKRPPVSGASEANDGTPRARPGTTKLMSPPDERSPETVRKLALAEVVADAEAAAEPAKEAEMARRAREAVRARATRSLLERLDAAAASERAEQAEELQTLRQTQAALAKELAELRERGGSPLGTDAGRGRRSPPAAKAAKRQDQAKAKRSLRALEQNLSLTGVAVSPKPSPKAAASSAEGSITAE